MRRLFIGFLVLGLYATLATSVQAGALNLLTTDGVPDFLEDDDFESIIDLNSSGGTNVGDAFVGVIEMQKINGTSITDSNLTAVLAARIDAISVSGSVTTFTFGALSAGEYTTLSGLFPSLPTRTDVDTAIIVFEDNVSPFLDLTGTIDDAIGSAADGTEVVEFGFSGSTYSRLEFTAADNFRFKLALNVTENSTSFVFIPVTSAQTGAKK
ncbi:MAG: hypothetical protein ACE5KM_22600, partial [Planctomycetaceae bacterium]